MLNPDRVGEIHEAFHKYINKELEASKDYINTLAEDDAVHLPEFYDCWKEEMLNIDELEKLYMMFCELMDDWFKLNLTVLEQECKLSMLTK
jgi:hypothetical protein